MKISLWQQFSSNHSAVFTVVGRFDSPAQAQAAATEFEALLKTLSDWWDGLSVADRIAWSEKPNLVT